MIAEADRRLQQQERQSHQKRGLGLGLQMLTELAHRRQMEQELRKGWQVLEHLQTCLP